MKRDSWASYAGNSKLNMEEATVILKEIFSDLGEDCENLETEGLVSYSVYRSEKAGLRAAVLTAFTVFFAIVPIFFFAPKLEISDVATGERGLPEVTLTVGGILPVNRVEAVLHGVRIPVYEVSSHVYTIEPPANGEVTVNVELFNRQKVVEKFEVKNTDNVPPVFITTEISDGYIFFYVKDEGVGVDFENSYAVLENGEILTSDYYDAAYNYIAFPQFEGKAELFFTDNFKNLLHVLY